jgi:hypothetical protein
MLNLYYSSEAWKAVAEDAAKVIDFFRRNETIRVRDGRTFFGKVQEGSNFLATHVLTRRGATYLARAATPDDMANTAFSGDRARQLTHIPFLSVLLTKEDLLWVATSGGATPKGTVARSKAQLLLERVWSLHVAGLHGRKFDDNIADEIVRTVCYSGLDKIPQAALWISGPVVEVVVPSWQADTLNKLCSELEQEMNKTVVVTVGSGADTYRGSWKDPATKTEFVGTMSLVSDAEGNLRVRALAKALTLAFPPGSAVATSGPLRRGLAINTTQAAVLAALGPSSMLGVVDHLADMCGAGLGGGGMGASSVISASGSTSAVAHLLPSFKKAGSEGTGLAPDARLNKLVANDVSELLWLVHARRTNKTALDSHEEVGASSLISVMLS